LVVVASLRLCGKLGQRRHGAPVPVRSGNIEQPFEPCRRESRALTTRPRKQLAPQRHRLPRLVASSAHVSLAALRERLQATAQACRELGITRLYMPAVPAAERDSPAAYWTALGRELAGHAHALAGSGIRLGYHNHDWELKTREGGRTALDLIFAGAGDDPLDWQVDVAWLVRGGADPLVLLRRHGARVSSAHAKDLAPAGEKLDEDGWADVGHGTLDWPTLAAACRQAGARCLVAEHDNPSDPARFARNAHRFLSRLQG